MRGLIFIFVPPKTKTGVKLPPLPVTRTDNERESLLPSETAFSHRSRCDQEIADKGRTFGRYREYKNLAPDFRSEMIRRVADLAIT
jgi:hypothetical protein